MKKLRRCKWNNLEDVSETIAKDYDFMYKRWSIAIPHWSWTWYMRISEAIQINEWATVRNVSVFYQ